MPKKFVKIVAFSIRKQIFDHLKKLNRLNKFNLLKKVGIDVPKKMWDFGPVAQTHSRRFESEANDNKSETSEQGDRHSSLIDK